MQQQQIARLSQQVAHLSQQLATYAQIQAQLQHLEERVMLLVRENDNLKHKQVSAVDIDKKMTTSLRHLTGENEQLRARLSEAVSELESRKVKSVKCVRFSDDDKSDEVWVLKQEIDRQNRKIYDLLNENEQL